MRCLWLAAGVTLTFGAAVAIAVADTVTISTADCRRLVAHAPAPDVAFQPGVDVRGRAVVPADIGDAATIDLPEFIEIPLTVDAARRLGAAEDGGILKSRRGIEGKAALGTLTVKGDTLFWNGRQLQSHDEVLMAEACKSSLRARGIVLPEAKPSARD